MANKILVDDTYRIVKEKQIRDLWEQNKINAEKAIDLLKHLNRVLDAALTVEVEQNLFERELDRAEFNDDDDDEFI